MNAGDLPDHEIWQLLQEVALLVSRKNSLTIYWKCLLQHSLGSVNCTQKNLSRRKCTHLHYSKLFLLAKSTAGFCLSKLCLLSEMFMARAELVWLIHQSRKAFFFSFYFLSLQTCGNALFTTCISNKMMRLIKYQVFKLLPLPSRTDLRRCCHSLCDVRTNRSLLEQTLSARPDMTETQVK